MKRLVFTALVILTASAHAQDTTGNAAVSGSSTSSGNSWDTWIFTGGSLAAAATGLIVVFANGLNGPNVGDPFTPTSH